MNADKAFVFIGVHRRLVISLFFFSSLLRRCESSAWSRPHVILCCPATRSGHAAVSSGWGRSSPRILPKPLQKRGAAGRLSQRLCPHYPTDPSRTSTT